VYFDTSVLYIILYDINTSVCSALQYIIYNIVHVYDARTGGVYCTQCVILLCALKYYNIRSLFFPRQSQCGECALVSVIIILCVQVSYSAVRYFFFSIIYVSYLVCLIIYIVHTIRLYPSNMYNNILISYFEYCHSLISIGILTSKKQKVSIQ